MPKKATNVLIVGLIAGTIIGILTLLFITPLILQAELYETTEDYGKLAKPHVEQTFSHDKQTKLLWQRNLLTIAGTVLLIVCYSIIFHLIYPFFPISNQWIKGLILGFIGFLLFNFIPSLGLPANPPGIEYAAKVTVRQKWWFSLLICESTAVALSMFFFTYYQKGILPKKYLFLGIILSSSIIFIPFFLGIPNTTIESVVPDQIISRFRQRSIMINFITWILLGTLATLFMKTSATSGQGQQPK